MPPLSVRADVGSVNAETRTVSLIFSTGAPVVRTDPWTGKQYREVLSMEPKHIRLERLNNGAPLLDGHAGWSVGDVLGTVQPGSARIEKGLALADVRFSKRESVEPIFQDVQDGILRSISVGYRVYTYQADPPPKDGGIPTRTAIDWEPHEVSLVPMPADVGARVRQGDKSDTNPCVILTRNAQETSMNDETRTETIVETNPLLVPAARATEAQEPSDVDLAVRAETARVQGIMAAALGVRMPQAWVNEMIEQGVSLVDAQTRALNELRKRSADDRGPKPGPSGVNVQFGEDPLVHVRAGVVGAILHRIAPDRFQLDDKSRTYRGLSVLDIGKAFLNARGVRTSDMSRSQLVDTLIARAGLHATADFPSLFEDAANKNLRAAYEAAPQTWQPLSKLVMLSDFKASRQLQVGDAPALLEIVEHGEYVFGTIGEAKESIQLKTYGRMFGITRQALINDDLNAFGEIPAAFGRKARDIESDLAWAQITSNPTMGDSVALFDASTHANLTGTGTVISVTSLGVGRAALRKQKGIDAATLLNLSARYLIVPAALETVADQYVTQITPALGSSVNPFAAGGRTPLGVIVEPRLDAASATAWYMATDVAQAPVLYHGVLDGQEGPQVTSMEGFDVDGMKFRCRIDVAFKAADWRAIYKNVGA